MSPAHHVALVRQGVWREVVLASWRYESSRWRCHLYGHKFGPERRGYEDAGYDVHTETWRECQRPNCGAVEETWNIYGDARGVMG